MSGAFRTSPSSSLSLLANEPPLYVWRRKLSIKLSSNPQNPTSVLNLKFRIIFLLWVFESNQTCVLLVSWGEMFWNVQFWLRSAAPASVVFLPLPVSLYDDVVPPVRSVLAKPPATVAAATNSAPVLEVQCNPRATPAVSKLIMAAEPAATRRSLDRHRNLHIHGFICDCILTIVFISRQRQHLTRNL